MAHWALVVLTAMFRSAPGDDGSQHELSVLVFESLKREKRVYTEIVHITEVGEIVEKLYNFRRQFGVLF